MDGQKIKRTIELLKMLKKYTAVWYGVSPVLEGKDEAVKEYFDIAIEALEKQLPRKVEIKEWSPSVCPCCGYELSESIGDGFYKHPTFLERCPNPDCGQRLEWDE